MYLIAIPSLPKLLFVLCAMLSAVQIRRYPKFDYDSGCLIIINAWTQNPRGRNRQCISENARHLFNTIISLIHKKKKARTWREPCTYSFHMGKRVEVKRIAHGKPLDNVPDFSHLQTNKPSIDWATGYTDYPLAKYD